mgnify:FL=1
MADVDNEQYLTAHKVFEARSIDENRFVNFEDRETQSVLTAEMTKILCHGKYQTTWNGVEVMKSPLDLITMQDLFSSLKPATVIEFGSYSGGSALWFADMVKCFGIKSNVYSVDISFDCLHETAKKREDITFIKADVTKEMDKIFPEKMLKELPHPWFISEDCHAPLEFTFGHFEPFMEPGDYILVEDTHPLFAAIVGQGLYTTGFREFGMAKYNNLTEFLKVHAGKFMVDCHYTDFFGKNASSSMNGYLKRV